MDTTPGFLHNASVRADRANDLDALIRALFARRHLRSSGAGSQQQMWMVAEFVQQLRKRSAVFKRISSKMEGPIPFGLGHCTVKDGALVPVARPLPLHHPEVFARVVSEFVEAGAVCYVAPPDASPHGWRIDGVDTLIPLDTEALKQVDTSLET
ncbi:hypothetical protein [Longimonas halophila]|nr:hypothetical protein [Longimonas halophila]